MSYGDNRDDSLKGVYVKWYLFLEDIYLNRHIVQLKIMNSWVIEIYNFNILLQISVSARQFHH